MANPRQRRKQRSGHKAVRHSSHAKRNLKKMPPLRAPKVLRDAWDSQLTVKQNYTRLGLLPTMNPRAKGGSEMGIHPDIVMTNAEESSDTPVPTKVLPKGYGRIVRDSEGNVIDIELGDSVDGDVEIDEDENALDLETRQLQPNLTSSERDKWVHRRVGNEKDSELIQELEMLSKRVGKVPRTASTGEKAWLVGVVTKYGADYDAAARDRKLNPWQRTAGEIKRSIAKAGGLTKLSR